MALKAVFPDTLSLADLTVVFSFLKTSSMSAFLLIFLVPVRKSWHSVLSGYFLCPEGLHQYKENIDNIEAKCLKILVIISNE